MAVGLELLQRVRGEHREVERLAGANALGGIDAADGFDRDHVAGRLLIGGRELGEDLPGRHRRNAGGGDTHGWLRSEKGGESRTRGLHPIWQAAQQGKMAPG